jgi:hypothetical protein
VKLGRHNLGFSLLFLKPLEDSYPVAAVVHRLFTTALAVGKKRKKSEEVVAAARRVAQSAKNSRLVIWGVRLSMRIRKARALDKARVVLRCFLSRAHGLTWD